MWNGVRNVTVAGVPDDAYETARRRRPLVGKGIR